MSFGAEYLQAGQINPIYFKKLICFFKTLCICLYLHDCRYLAEVRCVNTDSIHIVCSTNCVHCTVTNSTYSQCSHASNATATSQTTEYLPNSDEPSRTEYSFTDDESETGYSFVSDEPYTSEKLSRLRSGYRFLSVPSVAVNFNFNSQQVCKHYFRRCVARSICSNILLLLLLRTFI